MFSTYPAAGRRIWHSLALACLTLLAVLALGSTPAGAHKAAHGPTATASRLTPRSLTLAATRRRRADRALVADAKTLKRCLSRHPGHCGQARRALQRAGSRLASAEHQLAAAARVGRKASAKSSRSWLLQTPRLTVSGDTLTWARIYGLNSFVIEAKVPGQAIQYEVVSGTSTTPPPVPGETVAYRVRSSADWSSWSAQVSIAYPAPVKTAPPVETTPPAGNTPPVESAPPVKKTPAPPVVETQAAPALTVSGVTLTWNQVDGVSTYVLMQRIAGQSAEYSEVSGASLTPTSVPGKTVYYSIRTAVDGSAWSTEVSIAFPATAPKTPPVTEPPVTPPPVESTSSSFELGMVPGTLAKDEPGLIRGLGARTVRMEAEIGSQPSAIAGWFEEYAAQGIRIMPLAGFEGRIPTSAQAKSLASWAAAYGPGGTFWAGKSEPAGTAMTDIEFGNETSYSYQFSDNSASGVASRAQEYAVRFKEAYEAIHAANPNVKLLAQADNGNSGNSIWVENLFKAVPNIGSMVGGWTIHPYGPGWEKRINELLSQVQAVGAPSSIPVYVTEWGLATDNGRCLSNNYGWNPCMTYAEAGEAVTSTIKGMVSRYGSRLAGVYIYQAQDLAESGDSSNRESYFGARQENGASKGAFTTAIQSLLSQFA